VLLQFNFENPGSSVHRRDIQPEHPTYLMIGKNTHLQDQIEQLIPLERSLL
jgi:hypothetical protein